MMGKTTVPVGAITGSYLTDGYSLRSWLLTTDHKRIALLYLASITFFFFIGGIAAALVRLTVREDDFEVEFRRSGSAASPAPADPMAPPGVGTSE